MNVDPIEEFFKDPDKRAKLYLFMSAAMILTTIIIALGFIIYILILLGVI